MCDIFTTVHVGYLTLFNSIVSTLQAKTFSIENAAVVSTYFGFLVQLIPVYIILFTTHTFWDTALKKVACTLVAIIFMAPEIWLNTTNSHFIFGFITFLIMLISTSNLSIMQKYLFRMLLLIGGLTGPASILFTPMFIVKTYREKSREKIIQASILTICAIIQTIIIMYAILYNNTYHRLSASDFKRTIYHLMVDNFSLNIDILSYTFNFLFAIVMATYYIYLLIKTRKDNDYLISLLSLLIVGSFSTLGSLNMGGSPRYTYIPTCIYMIVIISEVFDRKINQKKHTYFATTILIISLAVNLYYYLPTMETVYSPNFPKWADEVAKWRADSTYALRIHPGSNANQCIKL
ncbi:MAG TPA: hypothetical protein VF411_03300 [Bacteroidia bacterium]